ncbi:hypothetical protein [Plantactinospora endophytica]|uniref:Uncharacterized protein n=1 Tax=Plantactinospora endophytica TaxID=673535 RepID=A0ABQ4DSZ5_9ACTN|nr:hypothetical protein [Plantactinospora endophytica]GIG85585.1 hypothetical protein Pen02_05210 [Plantactinospora endophytica]
MPGTEKQHPTSVTRNDDRSVERAGEHRVLPEQSVDDTDRGWGERPESNDDRLLAERPPHWG